MKNFKDQLLSGVIWTALEAIINRSFKFVIKLILARILFPEDYGIIGMAVVFTSIIGAFNEMGMGVALIQRKKEKLHGIHFHTAFWTGIIWGVFLFIIMAFVISPIAAEFYNEPILNKIIPVLSLGILATPINIIHKAKLIRALNFKRLSFISNSSNIFSGILALGLALNGAGVWSLVFNSIAAFVVAMPLFFLSTKYFPKFEFSKKAFKEIFGFGIYTTGTRLLYKITGQVDYLIVGKLLGAASLGIYSLAFLLTSIFRSQITQVIDQVLYPLFSKMQDDPLQMKKYYLKIIRLNAMAVYPIMFGIFLFSDKLILILFGEKWLEAIPILRILSIGVIINMVTTSNSILIRAAGKPSLELKIISFNSFFFFVPLIIIGTYYYGVTGTAGGYVVATFFSVIVILRKISREFKITFTEFFNAIKVPFIVSFIPFILSGILFYFNSHWVIAVIAYLVLIILMMNFFAKEEVNLFKENLQKLKNQKLK